jgi:hypothetical protein
MYSYKVGHIFNISEIFMTLKLWIAVFWTVTWRRAVLQLLCALSASRFRFQPTFWVSPAPRWKCLDTCLQQTVVVSLHATPTLAITIFIPFCCYMIYVVGKFRWTKKKQQSVLLKMAVFWIVSPCSLVRVYQRFRGLYCLHHQGDWNSPFKFYMSLFLQMMYLLLRSHFYNDFLSSCPVKVI